jgi:hypothetical protein
MKNLIRKILKEQDWFDDIVAGVNFEGPEEFLYNIMKNLTLVESKNIPGLMLYKDEKGVTLMADNINRDKKNPTLWVDYDKIWSKLREDFGLNSQEASDLCKRMLEITHKRKVFTAAEDPDFFLGLLEITHKRKMLTAPTFLQLSNQRWR